MQKQDNKFNGSLIAGLLIGSVAGLLLGAGVTEIVNRLAGKNWSGEGQRETSSKQVDPRWLLQ